MESTELTTQRLANARLLLAQTVETGVEITQELDIQRTKLLGIKKSVEKTDEHVNYARRLLNRMKRNNAKRNAIVGGVSTLCLAGLVGAIIATRK